MISTKETGKRIRKLLADSGISVREVQEYIGLESAQAVYKWLYGKSLPTVENMLLLSRLLGINMEELLVEEREAGLEQRKKAEAPVFLLEVSRPQADKKEYLRYQKALAGSIRNEEYRGKLSRKRERGHMPDYTRRKLLKTGAEYVMPCMGKRFTHTCCDR